MKIDRIKSAIKLFKEGYGEYKKQIILLSILGFFSGILEGIGVNAIIPLFSFISGGQNRGTDLISRMIEGFFHVLHINYSLKYLLIFICALFIVKAAAIVWFNYINVKITTDYEKKTRNELFRDTLTADWPYLLKQKIGYLEQILITDINRGSTLLRHLSGTILLITNLIMYIAVALNISALITSLTILTGAILFITIKPFFYKARVIALQQAQITKQVANLINENMIGIKTVKAANKENQVINNAGGFFEKLRETSVRGNFLSSINNGLIEPVGILFIVTLFAISYKLPGFSIGSFAVIIYLIQKIFSYLQVAQNRLQTISELEPYLGIILRYKQDAQHCRENDNGKLQFSFKKSLEFKNVSFSYTDGKEVLNKINFTVNKGEMIGLIGPSGAGKTTLVDLLLRLFNPSEGKILLDGTPITDILLSQWREKISYVSQDIFLVNDSIANNIKFYEQKFSQEDMIEAAKIANIYDFIQKQPDGFDTIVGERGTLLSGGQRQRIILARALIRKPQLLVLDEATSALDNESEVMIQKAIENLKGKLTVIIVAHRLSTIINSDNLLALEHGYITQQGSPKELISDENSYFYKVYNIRNS